MGFPHFQYTSVTSTNDVARELLREYPAVFVSALYQTRGRGRHGRPWLGDAGKNVYCSLGLRHPHAVSPREAAALLALGAVAVWETVEVLTQTPALFMLKYPNDLLGRCPDGAWRKVAGVLVEHASLDSTPISVIGIGINVGQTEFPASLSSTATSLAVMGFSLTPHQVLEQLKGALERLSNESPETLFERWSMLLQIEGRLIRVQGMSGLWRVLRLREDGGLEVECNGSRLVVTDGDTIRYLSA
jgi:BirA family biotin operon repressor/biotin-[acetyl-CoA-carboxylase] ligase